jgi:lipopolysaccharide/colanic/teichoic acid biosynthesis glycosyltransferase
MKTGRLSTWILLADLLWVAAATLGAGVLRYGVRDFVWSPRLWLVLLTTWVIWLFLSARMRLDGFRGGWRLPAMISHIFIAVACEMCGLLTLGYLARNYVSRLALIYFGLLLLVGFIAIRSAVWFLLRARNRSGDVWKVVILGSGRVARELASRIEKHPEMLCRVIGILVPEGIPGQDPLDGQAIQGTVQLSTVGIMDLLYQQQVNEIILALPHASPLEIQNVVVRCQEAGIRVSLVPEPYELYLARPRLLDVDGVPVLQFQERTNSASFFHLKRLLDVVLTVFLGIFALPFLLVAAALLRLHKGSGLRWEPRCGQFGVPFPMLRLNVDRHVALHSTLDRLLDRLSLTELPQLWNVLRGEMSLVGPRPEPLVRVQRYSEWHQQRLSIKPGMTGLAQVHGLRDLNSSEQKARFDLQYMMNLSLLSDLSLLLQTVWTIAVRMIRMPAFAAASAVAPSTAPHPKINLVQEMLSSADRSQSSAD